MQPSICHHLLCNKRIKWHVLTYSLGHPLVFCAHILVQIRGVVSCIHTPSCTNTAMHSIAQTGAGLLLWCPSCQVVLLLPGTCHRGDSWLHHQRSPERNGTLKERNHLSILLSAYFSDSRRPFFFCPLHPPSPPLLRLSCPRHRFPFSSKTLKKMKEKKKSWQI